MLVLIAILLAIVLTTYNRYGFTFDEFKGLRRATRILLFLAGKSADMSGVDAFHGAAPDVLALILQKLVPPLSFDSRHLVFALFGIAGVYYVYRFGSKFIGEWVGVFAAIFLAVTPMWFGYMFINHKDIPFATLLLASSYYTLLALTDRPTSRGLWLKVGLAIGLLASTKVAGLPLLVYVVAVYLACFAMIHGHDQIGVAPNLVQRIGWTCLAGVFGSLICFLVFWPQFYVLDFVFRDMGPKTMFARELNRFYASMYFAISTPTFLWYSPQSAQAVRSSGGALRSLPRQSFSCPSW